jgi:hypothetical protein
MACHGVISAGFCRNRFCIKLEITPPSISNHSRYGTCPSYGWSQGGHDHASAWSSKLPVTDLKAFWGALGCARWLCNMRG